MRNIRFTFEGKSYTAPASFYETGLAKLPDGRVVRPHTWLESLPPKPQGLHIVEVTEATEVAEPTPAG